MNFSKLIKSHLHRSIELKKSNRIRLHEIMQQDDTQSVDNKQQDVLTKIENNQYEQPNANTFTQALNKSKHKEMLTDYSVEELSQMKLFKLKGYDIGFALKKYKDGTYSEIVAVFNNDPTVKKIGKELMKSAIKNGGKYLDHFDGYLSQLYQGLGFEEHGRDKFDPQYDQDGSFRKKYGEADVVYRTHNGQK